MTQETPNFIKDDFINRYEYVKFLAEILKKKKKSKNVPPGEVECHFRARKVVSNRELNYLGF